jgi:hypothetical protein
MTVHPSAQLFKQVKIFRRMCVIAIILPDKPPVRRTPVVRQQAECLALRHSRGSTLNVMDGNTADRSR